MVPEKVTVAPAVALRPVAGVQVYVVAPLAVIVVVAPRHTAALPTAVAITGMAFTVISRVAILLQPVVVLVPVTV